GKSCEQSRDPQVTPDSEAQQTGHDAQPHKMAKASRLRVGIIAAALLVAVIFSALPILRHAKADSVSLVFQRYSTSRDLTEVFDHEVAFLWITNASDKIYRMAMTGNESTRLRDDPFGFEDDKESFKVACDFKDQTAGGIVVSMQSASFSNPLQSLALSPHSAVRL